MTRAMTSRALLVVMVAAGTASAAAGCRSSAASVIAGVDPGDRVYVSSEESGDVVVIDARRSLVAARIPVGKRPRGLRLSPDGRTLYVALSGSPKAPPGVDESTLPPPDRAA